MTRPHAVVVSTTDDSAELEELLYSLGYDVVDRVVQHRERPDPATYLGAGKVSELRNWLSEHGVTPPALGRGAATALLRAERAGTEDAAGATIPPRGGGSARSAGAAEAAQAAKDPAHERGGPRPVTGEPSESATSGYLASAPGGPAGPVKLIAVNDHLKPSQLAALERLTGVDVYDRVRVILEIFQQRASTREAKLQVELARLRYERPLVREYIHLSKRGEHPGFLAGGAYAVDQYYDTINARISRIQQDLAHFADERETRRKHRRRGGFFLVSLAGYANAGKSSMLKALSGEDVLVENRMFSTLQTRTGHARAGGRDVLVTDTVGFISGLPPELVAAFRSTLEEIAYADCIVLVCDASDPPREAVRKLQTSLRVLLDYEDLAPVVLALNKSDRVDAAQRGELERAFENLGPRTHLAARVWFSALTGAGLDGLVEAVVAQLSPLQQVRAFLPTDGTAGSLLSAIYAEAGAEGTHSTQAGDRLQVVFAAPTAIAGSLAKRIREAGGEAEFLSMDGASRATHLSSGERDRPS